MYDNELQIDSILGFQGKIKDGLILHPANNHLIYSVGATIIIQDVHSGKQTYLRGHTNRISVLKVSRSGKYIASGQTTNQGEQADVIIWDFDEKSKKHQLKLHKVKVVSLDFSENEMYLASQGGMQDRNMLIIWDLDHGKSIYGLSLKSEVIQVKFFRRSDTKLLVILKKDVQILSIDKINKKINSTSIQFGNGKHIFSCCDIDRFDKYAYVGTMRGDFYEIILEKASFKRVGPNKKLFSSGITKIKQLSDGNIIIGSGDGYVSKISIKTLQILLKSQVMGGVTSLQLSADESGFFCGTYQSNIFWVNINTLATQLKSSSHHSKINSVIFPAHYSDVFATCSIKDIRIWNAINKQQLLRIQIPGVQCHVVDFMPDGKLILSGWSDGRIRAFLPQSGKLLYGINDAHIKGVTAIKPNYDCNKIISGGQGGQVRVWKVSKKTQYMQASMKIHRNKVWSIQLLRNGQQAISCSQDGICAIWNLNSFQLIISVQQNKISFKQLTIHQDQFEFITVGSNGKVQIRQKFDGQKIRSAVGNEKWKINSVKFTQKYDNFVTGGQDNILKIWRYSDAKLIASGIGHTQSITKLAISPDQKLIVTIGQQGAIIMWNMPSYMVDQLDINTQTPFLDHSKSYKDNI